jgi:hypothetical protein
VGLEGFVLLGLRGDEVVEAGEARGDALLFVFFKRNAKWAFGDASFAEMRLVKAIIECQQARVPIEGVVEEFAVDLLWLQSANSLIHRITVICFDEVALRQCFAFREVAQNHQDLASLGDKVLGVGVFPNRPIGSDEPRIHHDEFAILHDVLLE